MSLEKNRIKELKRPDTFQKKALALIEWGVAHRTQFLMALVPLALVAGGYFIWQTVNNQRSENRRSELAAVDQLFIEEAEASIKQQEEIQKKIGEIDEKLKAKPEGGAAPADIAALSAEKAKLEADFKALKPNHAASLTKFTEFYKQHEKQPEGWRAALNAVGILVDQEQYKEAAELLEGVLPHASQSPFYNVQARSLYIALLEELGNYDKALEEIDKLIGKTDDDLTPRFLLTRGRLQLLSGQKDQAQVTFDKIIGEHNTSLEAKKAKTYKAL